MKTKQNTTTNKQLHFSLIVLSITLCLLHINYTSIAQNCLISDFTSINPDNKDETLRIPPTHTFQKIIQSGNQFPNGGTFNHIGVDFTGYVPIEGSSTNGYLSINDEWIPGGVAVLDIEFENNTKLWKATGGENLDFDAVGGTARNCSGAVTPWGTVISSEEVFNDCTNDNTEYKTNGWQVEIDPATKEVLAKHYAMGNFKHENAAILEYNGKTIVYQGADQTDGFLFKYVCFQKDDLSNGDLYVYKGPGPNDLPGIGNWVKIRNQSIADRNCTVILAHAAGGTIFKKIEDVELSPDGLVYFAASSERGVFYLEDKDPDQTGNGQVEYKGIYVGKEDYPIQLTDATVIEKWGIGNDNMAFDNEGNLWVLFDSTPQPYIWVVRKGHTQANPKVEIFATAPNGSEPTGITFSPDNRFMFVSMQHPSSTNTDYSIDAAGKFIQFNKEITLVIARKEYLGSYGVDCELDCQANVIVNGNAPSNTKLQNLYESSDTIYTEITNSPTSDVVVYPNDTVDLKSANITLNAGFEVEKGGCLNVVIEPCE